MHAPSGASRRATTQVITGLETGKGRVGRRLGTDSTSVYRFRFTPEPSIEMNPVLAFTARLAM
jgi:hypothetical protein